MGADRGGGVVGRRVMRVGIASRNADRARWGRTAHVVENALEREKLQRRIRLRKRMFANEGTAHAHSTSGRPPAPASRLHARGPRRGDDQLPLRSRQGPHDGGGALRDDGPDQRQVHAGSLRADRPRGRRGGALPGPPDEVRLARRGLVRGRHRPGGLRWEHLGGEVGSVPRVGVRLQNGGASKLPKACPEKDRFGVGDELCQKYVAS